MIFGHPDFRIGVFFLCTACDIINAMKRIDEDIKNHNFARVYLLYGEQAYLRNQYRDKLIKALVPEGDNLNYMAFEGDGTDFAQVRDFADTMPFLAEYRVVLVENSGMFNEANDELADYLAGIPDTTVMIFSEEKVNGKFRPMKAAKSNGAAIEFTNLREEELRNWVVRRLAGEHRQITGLALDRFISICGTDMMAINTELEKLISYSYGKPGIYPEDIDAICTVKAEDKVFLMMDAMFRHNTDEALKYYSDLVALHHAPIQTMAVIASQLRLLLHVKEMDASGLSTAQIARDLGTNEYRIKKSLPQARKSSRIWIMKGIELCADMDEAAKTGNIDFQIGLEYIICSLSKGTAGR